MQQFFNYSGVSFNDVDASLAPANDIEELFYDAMANAKHRYWEGHPRFDCRNTQLALPHLPCPRIDVPCLLRLFDFALKHRFGRLKRSRRSPRGGELTSVAHG
jgi:hypothetical protein